MKPKKGMYKDRADYLESAFIQHRDMIRNDPELISYSKTTFTFLTIDFDIERAHYLARFHTPDGFEIDPIVKAFGLHKPETSVIGLDKKKIKLMPDSVFDEPIYIATLYFEPDRGTAMLIDGWHRTAKACAAGLHALPAVTFSPIETMWIMHELNIYTEA